MVIGDIAMIRAGLVITRKKAENTMEVKAVYPMFTIKNIDVQNEVYEDFKSNEVLSSQHFTQVGDILFRLNYPYSAVYIDETKAGLLVPSTFVIIKVNSKQFLPEYVSWYMNTTFVKQELEKAQSGTRIPTTNKVTLSAIPIELINLKKQQDIIHLYRLHLQEKQLLTKLIVEKEKWFHAVTNKLLQ